MPDVADSQGKQLSKPVASALRAALRQSNTLPVRTCARMDIRHEGDQPDFVYLVESGWLYSYCMLADGQRQILFLHKPGDMAGFSDIGATSAICSLRSLRDCVLHPVPTSTFTSSSFLTPAVTMFVLRKSAEMQAILMRTLTAVGRMGARDRIVWLLLLLHDRLHGAQTCNEIELPLNQTELGDLIGLTNVSVSKILCQLSDGGFIERKGKEFFYVALPTCRR